MKKITTFLFLITYLANGQTNNAPAMSNLRKAYCQAIAEYIKAETKNDTLHFDTLYVGKHEEFPEIKLPKQIDGKKIILLTYHQGDSVPQNRHSFILVNVIATKFTNENAAFMLVTFHEGYQPQHNMYINLYYNAVKNEYELDKKIRYEYNYSKNK